MRLLALACLCLCACLDPVPGGDVDAGMPDSGNPDGAEVPDGGFDPAAVDPIDIFLTGLPKGSAQTAAVCARGHADKVATVLCASPPAPVDALRDLASALGLVGTNPQDFALLAHSESIAGRYVSSINPRAFLFTHSSGLPTDMPNDGSRVLDPGFVVLSFVRGEQIVELAAHDPTKSEIHFYLLKFRQACNKFGCKPGDLYTPSVEKDWTDYTLYEDVDLANTALDCTHCHRPGGPTARKILRMQERKAPWTHWLRNNLNEPGGVALIEDFTAAHSADEDYAGIPVSLLTTPRSDPLLFEALVENNSLNPQPNEFPGGAIEVEVKASASGQPKSNVPRGMSNTWNGLFAQAVTGTVLPAPYHDVKVTDPNKLSSLTAAYRAVQTGAMPAASLPDLRDIFLEEGLPEMGYRPKAGATGAEILSQMCRSCHDGTADPSLSKSRFDVTKLATMPASEKAEAIARLNRAKGSTTIMPPVFVGELSAAEIALVTAALQ